MAKTLEEIEKEVKGIQSQIPGLTEKVGEVISSANIQPNEEIQYNEPIVPPVYDISKLEFGLTPPQEKEQTLTEQLQALNLSLVGESVYRTEQEKVQDIVGLTKTRQDLTSQLKLLQAEYQQIPLQIQEEFAGRGATAAGVAPIEAGRLRKISIRALGVSALMEAASGNLATAQDLVDRAVAQEFDPIREEINAKMANLELITRSPEYTQAEKKRAEEQKAELERQKTEIETAEAEQKEIWRIATDAAQRGANALTLQKIRDASTKEEALRIATEAGLFIEEEKPEYLSVSEAKALGVPYGTTKEDARAMGVTPVGTTPVPGFKFTSDDRGRLNVVGVSNEDVTQIQEGIKDYGWAVVKQTEIDAGRPEEQIAAIESILGGVTPSQIAKGEKDIEDAMLDLGVTIDDYKELWKKEGDKNRYGTREQFGEELDKLFPELNKDEIMDEIYKEVSNEWMKENTSAWRKVFGVPKPK